MSELRTDEVQRKFRLLKKDPVYFVKTVLGMTPYPYQEIFLRNKSSRKLACTSRQIGKSTTGQWAAIHRAITTPNQEILIISRSQEQSSEFLRDIVGMVTNSELVHDIGKQQSTTKLSFKNGSLIASMPCSIAAVRGYSPNLVILDEAAHFEADDIFEEGVRPMLMHTHGDLMILSTPKGKRGFFWDMYTEWKEQKDTAVWHIPIMDQDGTIVCPAFRKEDVERERKEMNNLKFRQEYMAEFIDDSNAYFPYEIILPCTEDYNFIHAGEPGKIYHMGVDWGQVKDSTVITIVEPIDDVAKVVYIKEFEKWNYNKVLDYIGYLAGRFNLSKIYVDVQSGGKAQYDELRARGLPAEGVTFSWQMKDRLFGELRRRFEQKLITIPNNTKLIEQLNSFGAEFSAAGRIMFHHAPNAHDDYVDSLALAVWGMAGSQASFAMI